MLHETLAVFHNCIKRIARGAQTIKKGIPLIDQPPGAVASYVRDITSIEVLRRECLL